LCEKKHLKKVDTMTALTRTPLTTPQKLNLTTQVLSEHMCVTRISEEFNISRPTLYATKGSIQKLLTRHFEAGEIATKRVTINIDEAQLQRALIALRVIAPNSIRAIEALLPILYPGIKRSYGAIQKILSEAEQQAKQFNMQADLSGIKASALDEMYSQGAPVLAGIDLEHGYLHSLELRESRSGEDWHELLEQAKQQGLNLEIVVKDAAKGIAAGVAESFPQAEQRDDCFHVLYDTNKLKRKLRARAYHAIDHEYRQEVALGKIRAMEKERRKQQKQRLAKAKEEAVKHIERYDTFERAAKLIEEAMEYVHPETGELYSGKDVELMMRDAALMLDTIESSACKKLSTYIHNRAAGIALATTALHTKWMELSSVYGTTAVSCTALLTRLSSELKKKGSITIRNKKYQFCLRLYKKLRAESEETTGQLIDAIQSLLEKRYRASSAIEGFNAALRPYLYVHKGVTQGFLELFRAYHNLRLRRWGRHKGTSAHESLNGAPVKDWLSQLGYPLSTAVALAA